MERFLGVPILVGDHLFGMLYLTDRVDGKPFSEQDQWLIETTAGYAALAIAGVELREQQRRVALLEERDRISMELHDGVIQSLYAIGMYLELMRTSEAVKPEDLTEAIHNLDTVITDIRSYIQNLKARERQAQSLEDSLREIVKRLHVPPTLNVIIEPIQEEVVLHADHLRSGLPDGERSPQQRHPPRQRPARLYHARRRPTHLFTLTISDDGKGFDPQQRAEQRRWRARLAQHAAARAPARRRRRSSKARPTEARASRLIMPVTV